MRAILLTYYLLQEYTTFLLHLSHLGHMFGNPLIYIPNTQPSATPLIFTEEMKKQKTNRNVLVTTEIYSSLSTFAAHPFGHVIYCCASCFI
jgi:hypothetical protein